MISEELTKEEIYSIIENNEKFTKENQPKNEDRVFQENRDNVEYYIKRQEISKDRDRILYSKAFRRLEHKAQVYSHEKGDHYRTRLTHTLEVMQISRSIAKNLGLNEELTEAIALGHDIGHTPFGHVGEEVLDNIMRGNDKLGGMIRPDFEKEFDFGGFKHNFFSVEILDNIEHKFKNYEGLNLTWQVLEGILRHTKIIKGNKKWNLDRFMKDSANKELLTKMLKYNQSVTLEGQIVNTADEIAQRQHDLDDGLRDIGSKITINQVIKSLQIDSLLSSAETDHEKKSLEIFDKNLKTLLKRNNQTEEYKRKKLTKEVINYFIKDITYNSIKKLKDLESFTENINSKIIVTNRLIKLSKTAHIIDKRLEKCIKTKILNSYNVNRFDGKSKFIIRQLFKAYYTNPRQMPKERLDKLYNTIKKNNEIYILETSQKNKKGNISTMKKISEINFENSKHTDIEFLLEILKLNKLNSSINKLNAPSKVKEHIASNNIYVFETSLQNKHVKEEDVWKTIEANKKEDTLNLKGCDEEKLVKAVLEISKKNILERYSKKNISILLFSKFDKLKNKKDSEMDSSELFYKCLLENHYAYLKIICEYIAKMTDNFANEEYKKLYQV